MNEKHLKVIDDRADQNGELSIAKSILPFISWVILWFTKLTHYVVKDCL